jgi:hypothetical protein
MTETEIALLFCGWLAGAEVESRAYFDTLGQARHVRIDCETDTHVIEVGLDGTASARDSVHQAVFAATLTGKVPMVVLIDRDGAEGRYEREMRAVAAALEIPFAVCPASFVTRWRMTAPFRVVPARADDLPGPTAFAAPCDIATVYRASRPALTLDPDKARAITGN